MSTTSRGSQQSQTLNDLDPDLDDLEVNNNLDGGQSVQVPGSRGDKTEAWWSVGEYLEGRPGVALTHQSAKFTLTGNRVFGKQQPEEVWDLTDSIAELYERSQVKDGVANHDNHHHHHQKHHRKGHDHHAAAALDKDVNIEEWLEDDTSHGFIRVYPANLSASSVSQLVPCSLSTSAHRICLMLGISINALHVQLNGDVIRRLDPYEHPLVLQNELLAGLGYTDLGRIQQEGTSTELAYLIRFYAGKPLYDSTFSRSQLQAYIEVKKGGVLQQWMRRLCVLSGTRLLIYKDKFKRGEPTAIQLAKGSVEEIKIKGHELCLKLWATVGGDRVILLSFTEQNEYNKWFRKCKKATDKLPTTADLSNCHLEFLPENLFINEQLAMLNLRHNVLRERPLDEDIYTIGWLDDLHRFNCLRSLNLADNNLVSFPSSLCTIRTLVELNIASNHLEEIPVEICQLTNLQALHVHNNHLNSLPDEMVALRKLFILVLAFNHFTELPPVVAQMTNVRISEVENIIMAGNEIERISSETLMEMKYVKKVDLRMNLLTLTPTETMRFTVLEHLTHLDIRDNQVTDLDIRALKTLEYLNVERNDMVSLQANGMALKNLFAAHNCLEKLVINPKPEWLLQADLSYNCLYQLPDWMSDCFFLQKLWVGNNLLTHLPQRLLADARKLKSLRADHNRLVGLPVVEAEYSLALEEAIFHHNLLASLPPVFLARSNKLRVLNVTKNRLSSLPDLNPSQDLNKVQELYLSDNCLGDTVMQTVTGYRRLKVLHIAHNEIYNLYDKDIKHLEMLQELNISGNQLRSLPVAVGQLQKLVVLRAHSNILHSLPDFKQATSLRILDVGHNQLLNVSVTNLMASQLNLLDMSLNDQLKVNPREFKSVKNRKNVCLVDLTGQNRMLPGLSLKRKSGGGEAGSNPGSCLSSRISMDMDPDIPWKVGFSETSGMRNKLCVATLKLLSYRNSNESVFGMFDGGHNNEVPSVLLDHIESILEEELVHPRTANAYMKYTMLSAHRRLKGAGQRLGASAVLCHLHRVNTPDKMKHYTLNISNVGDVEAVLCRHGEALLLTRKFVTSEDRDECQRVYKSDGIITEDNKVNGTTKNTRLLGCGYLYPHIIPDPYTNTIALRNDDEFIIIGNRALWRYVSYTECVEQVYETGNPVVAAKQLQDLAQAYGSKENISILVIRLNTDRGPSLARLRQPKELSIDDMEAAVKHEAKLQKHRQKMAAKERREKRSSGVKKVVENGHALPLPEETEDVKEGEKVVDVVKTIEEVEKNEEEANCFPPPPPPLATPGSLIVDRSTPSPPPPPPESLVASPDTPDGPLPPPLAEMEVEPVIESPPTQTSEPIPPLKPLPRHRYLKKTAASEWEGILQTRLSHEVKDLEMKQLSGSISQEGLFVNEEPRMLNVPVDEAMQVDVRPSREKMAGSLKRNVTRPWSGDDPTQGYSSVSKERSVLRSTEPKRKPKGRGSIANTIALFENMKADPSSPETEQSPAGRFKNMRSISVPRERERAVSPGGYRDRSPEPPAHKKSRSPPPVLMSAPKSPVSPFQIGQANVSPSNRISLPPFNKNVVTETKRPAPPPPAKPAVATPTRPTRNSGSKPKAVKTVRFPPSPVQMENGEGAASPSLTNSANTVQSSEDRTSTDAEEKPNVSALVKMFGSGMVPEAKLNESVEFKHIDDKGGLHVYEVAKL